MNTSHIKILLYKNYTVLKRHPYQLIFLILIPILINIFIQNLQILADDIFYGDQQQQNEQNTIKSLKQQQIPKCYTLPRIFDKNNCISLGISIIGDKQPWVDYTLEQLNQLNQFQEQDVQILHQSKYPDNLNNQKEQSFDDVLIDKVGQVQIGLQIYSGDISIPKNNLLKQQYNQNGNNKLQEFSDLFLNNINTIKFDKYNLNINSSEFANNIRALDELIQDENYNTIKDSILQNYNISDLDFQNYLNNKNNTYTLKNYTKNTNPNPEIYNMDNYRYYTIFINHTQIYNEQFLNRNLFVQFDNIASILKSQLDKILINYEQKQKNLPLTDLDISTSKVKYPIVATFDDRNYLIASRQGAFYFFLGFLYLTVILQNEIVREKEYRLRYGLNIFGISHLDYYVSWLITGIVMAVFLAIYVVLLGYIFNFQVFTQVPIIYWLSIYILLGISLLTFTVFLTSLIKNLEKSTTIQFGFILLSMVSQIFLATDKNLKLLYLDENKLWADIVKFFLYLYAPFNFSNIFVYISQKSEMNQGIDFSDFLKKQSGVLVDQKYTQPSPFTYTMLLVLNSAFYLLLTYYFDNILEFNQGRSKKFYFFLEKYLCKNRKVVKITKRIKKYSRELQNIIDDGLEQGLNCKKYQNYKQVNTQESPQKQHQIIELQPQQTPDEQPQRFSYNTKIKIQNLTKIYNKYQKTEKKAINDLNLQIYSNEICALLGHNGAGKTTLMNILTGMLDFDDGNVSINGLDLKTQLDDIRQQIGICPQFDILWPELTPVEHMNIFCKIKGIYDKQKIQEITKKCLKQVNLYKVRNAYSSSFSGGMKRRLSLVISTIGDPSVIFLDEPSTGMDPKSRQQVWELIKQIKQNKSILLTTHAMEEADILSDRVVIISDGQLKCQGTSQDLKLNYGGGYKINIVCKQQNQDTIINQMNQLFPEYKLLDKAGGSIILQVENQQNLKQFILFMENVAQNKQGQNLKNLIIDWAMQSATLEEVFMEVTQKRKQQLYY